MLHRRAPHTRVLALEPDPDAARAFLTGGRWTEWIEAKRLVYLAGPAYEGHEQAWRVFDGVTDQALLTHPSLPAGSESTARAAQALQRIVFGVRARLTCPT